MAKKSKYSHARFEEKSWTLREMTGPEDFTVGGQGSCLDLLPEDMPDDRCYCCGKKIVWRCVCEAEDGEWGLLGMKCASKAGLPGVPRDVKMAKEMVVKGMLEVPEFRRWAVSQYLGRGKTVLSDLKYWAGRDPRRVVEYVNRYKEEGPLPAYEEAAPVALTVGKKASRIDVRLGWTRWHRKTGKTWAARIVGHCEQYELKRAFPKHQMCAEDGDQIALLSEPGFYEMCSGHNRHFVKLNSDGTAVEITREEVVAAFPPPVKEPDPKELADEHVKRAEEIVSQGLNEGTKDKAIEEITAALKLVPNYSKATDLLLTVLGI